MTLARKFALGVFLTALLASLTAVLVPFSSLTSKIVSAAVVAVLGAYVLSRYFTGSVNRFIGQFKRVSRSVVEAGDDNRMGIYSDDELGDAARRFNELVDTFLQRRRELREERNKFESILQELSDGVIAVDSDERVLYLNERARELLEVTSDQSTEGSPLLSEIVRDDTVQDAMKDCLETEGSIHREGKRVAPDREISITIDASPLTDNDGRVVGVVAAIHDVTELRRLQTVRQDFVANVSHELKTPITAIQGFIETLVEDEEMPPDTRKRFIKKIRDQVLRMSAMVEDLLTISKLESDEGDLESKRMDVTGPLKEALETIRPTAESKGIKLKLKLPSDPLYVAGDPAALRQIITNLLDNAVKYTPGDDDALITLATQKDDGGVLIEVEDTGIGIEPRKQDRIFERFYRVDSGRARSEGGTGLGLAIVKHLVLTMDGEIEVESTPGQGSLFRVRLPSP